MKLSFNILAVTTYASVVGAVAITPSASVTQAPANLNDIGLEAPVLEKRINPTDLFNGASFSASGVRFTIQNIQEQARSEYTKLDTLKQVFGTCATEAGEWIHDPHGPLGEDYFSKLLPSNIELFGQLQDTRFGSLWDNLPTSIMHDMVLAALNSAVDLYANEGISYVQWDVIGATGALLYTFAVYGKRK